MVGFRPVLVQRAKKSGSPFQKFFEAAGLRFFTVRRPSWLISTPTPPLTLAMHLLGDLMTTSRDGDHFFLMCQRSCESFDSTTKQGEPKLTMKLDANGLNGGNLDHVRRAKFREVVVECVIVRDRDRDIVSSNGFSTW